MSILSSFIVALASLRANALRSFLAMLGVIIGVASVVTMVAISNGAQKAVEQQINSLGTNTLMLRPGSMRSGGRNSGSGTAGSFSDKDVKALLDRVPDLAAVAGQVQTTAQIIAGNSNWSTAVQGVTNDYFIVRDWVIDEGNEFEHQDLRGGKVAILGHETAQELFGSGSVVGQQIRINKIPFRVIGVMKEKGQSSFGRSNDDVVFVPLQTARMRLLGNSDDVVTNYLRAIDVKVRADADVPTTEEEVKEVLRDRRKVKANDEDNFRIFNMADFLRARSETQATFTMLLAGTAGVALLVGGIGIMNIMLVSVTERTREIGLRMAIGAREKDIMAQFLIEAITLTVVGGLFGILLGGLCTIAAESLGQWQVTMDANIVLLAIGFSMVVGIFFGFYPARKASKLNPIEALRFD